MENDPLLQAKAAKCLALPGAEETFPFGPDAHVFKIAGKMFALLHRRPSGELYLSLKTPPAQMEFLLQEYRSLIPGYHLNKQHWLTIVYRSETDVEAEVEQELIITSYRLIFYKLTKKQQQAFRLKYGGEIFDEMEK